MPLPVTASVHLRKIALGPVLATACLGDAPAEVLAELDAVRRPALRGPLEDVPERGVAARGVSSRANGAAREEAIGKGARYFRH